MANKRSHNRSGGPRNLESIIRENDELHRQLESESDRTVALVGGACLDSSLESMLRAFFVDDEVASNALLGKECPISTFSARIKMAYSLGLIGPRLRADLDVIRAIRNACAHQVATPTFDENSFKDRVANLRPFGLDLQPSIRTRPPKEVFAIAVCGIGLELMFNRLFVSRCTLAKDHPLGEEELAAASGAVAGRLRQGIGLLEGLSESDAAKFPVLQMLANLPSLGPDD